MSAWIWVLIPLVAIIGGYIIDYQKNKLKWQNQTNSNEKELDELKVLIQQMKKRIENLEAIAAESPSDFQKNSETERLNRIEIDDQRKEKDKNKANVEQMAKNKGE